VETTGNNFTMSEVSADKAYLSLDNLQTVIDHHAMPYIPFKANSAPAKKSTNATCRRMYHYFCYNQSFFMQRSSSSVAG